MTHYLAEIERLSDEKQATTALIASQAAEIERLRADLERELKANRKLGDAYNAQAAEIAALRERVAKFEDYYKHYHKANYVTRGDEDFLTDDCDECPFDLRDPVHIRSQP